MKSQIFDENDGLTPLEKCQFCCFLNLCFHSREWLVFYIKRQKSFFHDLLSRSITWPVKQLVTEGYKGLQRVTEKPLFELERPQILFLGLFCLKTKVEEITKF